ncbi:hypothetical protein BT69DRAFT_1223793 [Atractiella rhizophila]|nr:hypothetical protein BT69DRAFT_1223793 [Atractiella rhizophila]
MEPDPDTPAEQDESRHPIAFLRRRPLLTALLKAAFLFIFSCAFLIVLIKTLLPPIDDPEDKAKVKIPKSFDDLKALNEVLQVYKDKNYARVLGTYICVYLFLQAFSLPGSMYLSILAGAMYGVLMALPLVCLCVATGALLCYLISALIGPALLAHSSKWRGRVDRWKTRVEKQGGNVISYLIVLRIAPLPPHWVVNVVCPHLGIGMGTFWIATFLGIMGVSFIHTQIGTTLDQMTSSADFHLISWRNFFGLAGIVVAVMVPVAIRYAWRSELEDAANEEEDEAGLPTHNQQTGNLVLDSDAEDDHSSFISNASLQSAESLNSYETYSSDGSGDEQEPFMKRKRAGSRSSQKEKGKGGAVLDLLGKVGVGKGKEKDRKYLSPGTRKKKSNSNPPAVPLQTKAGEASASSSLSR